MKKISFSLALIVLSSFFLTSCNEEIRGSLTFYTDGGNLYYHTKDNDEHIQLKEGDYKSRTDNSYTFEGIATRELPVQVRYLQAEKEGYTFLGWKQKIGDEVKSYIEDFSSKPKWNYSSASYIAYFEKNLTVTFTPIVLESTSTDSDGNKNDNWIKFNAVQPITIDSYNTYSLNAKDLTEVRTKLNSALPDSYQGKGSFTRISKEMNASEEITSVKVSEAQLNFYVPFEYNPNFTYDYKYGLDEKDVIYKSKEQKEPIASDSIKETKYSTSSSNSLSDLAPTYMEPYVEGKKFLGWYQIGEDNKEIKLDFRKFGSDDQSSVTGSNFAYPKFQSSIKINFDVDESLWSFTDPNIVGYADDVLDLTNVEDPISKDNSVIFSFWYYDANNDGKYDSDNDVAFKKDLATKIPSSVEGNFVLKIYSVGKPKLILDLANVRNYLNYDALVEHYGFKEVDGSIGKVYINLDKGSLLWDPSNDTIGLLNLNTFKTFIKPEYQNKFIINGFNLSNVSKLGPEMVDSDLNVVVDFTLKQKVTLHYATGVNSTGSFTYDDGETSYLDIGFQSTFANYQSADKNDLNGIKINKNISAPVRSNFIEYVQYGWKTSPISTTEMESFKVTSDFELELYSNMRKRVNLTLKLYILKETTVLGSIKKIPELSSMKEKSGIEKLFINQIELKNLFGITGTDTSLKVLDLDLSDTSSLAGISASTLAEKNVTKYPDSNKTYSVIAKKDLDDLISSLS